MFACINSSKMSAKTIRDHGSCQANILKFLENSRLFLATVDTRGMISVSDQAEVYSSMIMYSKVLGGLFPRGDLYVYVCVWKKRGGGGSLKQKCSHSLDLDKFKLYDIIVRNLCITALLQISKTII